MAIDHTASNAYVGNRFGARRTGSGPIGKRMSDKQRNFVATLITRQSEYAVRMLQATEPRGAVTAEMIAEAIADQSPAFVVRAIQDTLNQTSGNPSDLIETLLAHDAALRNRARDMERAAAQRNPEAIARAASVEDGATYRAPDGRVFHAYTGQQSGRILIKLWTTPEDEEASFVYYGSASRLPAGSVKLSTEEMQEFGRATGTCAICMRHLTDDESVARGIGPVCWGKL